MPAPSDLAVRGRFAPSPTGDLHLGNLRTALVSWLQARRSDGGSWIVRMEDLDRATSSPQLAERQLADLAQLGLVHDGEVVFQSDRFDRYRAAIVELEDDGLVYECFCTRREIREAASAPHGPLTADGTYPGTCRTLGDRQRRRHVEAGRTPALRLRTDGRYVEFADLLAGPTGGAIDDVVLQRNDGVPAYNLAVVLDDAAQHVTEVVRGDDLLSSTPRQIHLQRLLGLPTPRYAHVPLVLGADGRRLAKRHGAVTLADLAAGEVDAGAVLARLGASLGLCGAHERPSAADLVAGFDLARVPRDPWQPALDSGI